MRSAIASFHPRALPPMLRASYSRELLAWWFLPLMLGAVEGGAMGNIVRRAFDDAPGVSTPTLNLAVAAVVASPSLANITSFLWASLAWGRDKIRFIVGLQLATAACVGAVGLVSENGLGLFALVTLVIASRMAWTGVITLRTTVWANNYPRADRTRIAGRLATVQAIVFAIVGVGIGKAMDWNERSFHYLFPLSAVGGLIGVWIYGKVRLRGQRRLARSERAAHAHHSLSLNPFSVLRVLLHDARYRTFMTFMFIFGLGNLMLTAPLAIVLQEKFDVGYTAGILITTTIPAIIMPITIPLWQPLMAGSHIVRFRAIHAWTFVSASLIFLLAAVTGWLWVMFLAAVITGVAYAGGVLAWNLGHQDFAPPGRDSQYMGVHVTLTGIRGLMAPFLAVGIYQWLDSGAAGAGIWVFAVCLALNVAGALGFLAMSRGMRHSLLHAAAMNLPQNQQPLPATSLTRVDDAVG
jgi:hypothetical protein